MFVCFVSFRPERLEEGVDSLRYCQVTRTQLIRFLPFPSIENDRTISYNPNPPYWYWPVSFGTWSFDNEVDFSSSKMKRTIPSLNDHDTSQTHQARTNLHHHPSLPPSPPQQPQPLSNPSEPPRKIPHSKLPPPLFFPGLPSHPRNEIQ